MAPCYCKRSALSATSNLPILTEIEFIKASLQEDVAEGDHTSLACISPDAVRKGVIKAKEDGIVAGIRVAKQVFGLVDPTVKFEPLISDGDAVVYGDRVVAIEGKAISILTAERLALNFMQRMSGIASLTRKFVDLVGDNKAKLLDTRKTTPMFRAFQKEAVHLGGGVNHRFGLYDMIMIKDNHIAYAGGIEQAIKRTHAYLESKGLDLKIEIETASIAEVKEVLRVGGVHRIMLDNYDAATAEKAIGIIDGRFETEISGNVNLNTVAEYAATGVDYISVGSLTHSAKSLDLSLKAD